MSGIRNEHYVALQHNVLDGKISAYKARIPIADITLFDDRHSEERDPDGERIHRELLGQLKKAIEKRNPPRLMLYAEDGSYVLSDDYFFYHAYLELGVTDIPSVILGKPLQRSVDVVGPLLMEEVDRVFGIDRAQDRNYW